MQVLNRRSYLDHKLSRISGIQSGIIFNFRIFNKGIDDMGGLNIVTGGMPEYTKLLISPDHDMSYHISGYGNFFEEADIRFMGESVERYAGITAHILHEPRIRYCSRAELVNEGHKVMPLNLLAGLDQEQLAKMNKFNKIYRVERFTEDDKMHWVQAMALQDFDQTIWVPASSFFIGFTKDQIQMPSFTTGTACHEDIYRAFINSILEYVQIDAFMLHWYTDLPKQQIAFESLPQNLQSAIERSLGDNVSRYEILYVNYSDQATVNIPIVGVFILAKDETSYPRIAFGVQAGMDLDNAIYRGTQEALAVLEMSTYVPVNNPEIIELARDPGNNFFDLDSNVAFYALPEKEKENREFIYKYINETITYQEYADSFNLPTGKTGKEKYAARLEWLLQGVNSFSEYGCFLDITPTNIKDPTMLVMRVFIPELMQMSFPGFPYKLHPRYEGLNLETYPHALP
ncbi:MAG TPA: hypothetical protein GXX72_08825 [Clostridiaceae bacterium]|nr:hypothetical protein [Clostridiaceae bacterium]